MSVAAATLRSFQQLLNCARSLYSNGPRSFAVRVGQVSRLGWFFFTTHLLVKIFQTTRTHSHVLAVNEYFKLRFTASGAQLFRLSARPRPGQNYRHFVIRQVWLFWGLGEVSYRECTLGLETAARTSMSRNIFCCRGWKRILGLAFWHRHEFLQAAGIFCNCLY